MQKTYTSEKTGNKYKFAIYFDILRSRYQDTQYRVKTAQLAGNAHVRFDGGDMYHWSQKDAERMIDRQLQRWVNER